MRSSDSTDVALAIQKPLLADFAEEALLDHPDAFDLAFGGEALVETQGFEIAYPR